MFGTTLNALAVVTLVNLSLIATAPPPDMADVAQSAPLPRSDPNSVVNGGYWAPIKPSDAGHAMDLMSQLIDEEAWAFIQNYRDILEFLKDNPKYQKYANFVNDPMPEEYYRCPGYSTRDYLKFKSVVLKAIFKAEGDQQSQSDGSSDGCSNYFDCHYNH
ncbi:hypothetical protein H4R35_007054 [Dimargaris xerosporica]|nr:hypothetical protein H4R35_007054 [Dimargaris xerosporica]